MMPLYNDSKTHSKMDINYSVGGGVAPPPIPSTVPRPPDGSRGPFERFDVRAEFVKPKRGGVFQFSCRKKK